MRKLLLCLVTSLSLCYAGTALDRQPGADYRARREALAKKAGGVIVLVAPLEGLDAEYGFRQEDNFFYLSGHNGAGSGLAHRSCRRGARRNARACLYRDSLPSSPEPEAREIHRPPTRCGRSPGTQADRFRSS